MKSGTVPDWSRLSRHFDSVGAPDTAWDQSHDPDAADLNSPADSTRPSTVIALDSGLRSLAQKSFLRSLR